ncbi:Zn-finger nucleic acid-binding protein [Arthrobacter globiformis]|uniref:TFIIB-type zinc ribbon-containing protein n=1 Tax=Arthrobacter globiformis TaxID=1665 RepID=UPI002781B969|nr:zf-TFIIB domain-containing protein [Arthrobacter globiformis]MDQ1056277.1 Zn-finger nucleic acid-binding protein [Arthrobacter globiformis]
MKCPIDSSDLVMSERSGVEIDYCPQCRGVWLDRGELDKIIDRVNAGAPAAPPAPIRPAPASPAPGMVPPPLYRNSEPRRDQPRYDDRSYGKGYDRDNDRRRHKKKEGWLGDLFDF